MRKFMSNHVLNQARFLSLKFFIKKTDNTWRDLINEKRTGF